MERESGINHLPVMTVHSNDLRALGIPRLPSCFQTQQYPEEERDHYLATLGPNVTLN